MDAAALAAQSDPARNPAFSRRWTGPPPLTRKRPALVATSARAKFFGDNNSRVNSRTDATVQRALLGAEQRAARLDRSAETLRAIGQADASRRLAQIAADIRAILA